MSDEKHGVSARFRVALRRDPMDFMHQLRAARSKQLDRTESLLDEPTLKKTEPFSFDYTGRSLAEGGRITIEDIKRTHEEMKRQCELLDVLGPHLENLRQLASCVTSRYVMTFTRWPRQKQKKPRRGLWWRRLLGRRTK